MLPNITAEGLAALRIKEGVAISKISILLIKPGTLIRVITASDNCYFFEVTDPKNSRAHVARCDARPDAPNTGYRGERFVSEVFEIGEPIGHHGNGREAWTGEVTKIHLLAA